MRLLLAALAVFVACTDPAAPAAALSSPAAASLAPSDSARALATCRARLQAVEHAATADDEHAAMLALGRFAYETAVDPEAISFPVSLALRDAAGGPVSFSGPWHRTAHVVDIRACDTLVTRTVLVPENVEGLMQE